MFKFWGTQLMKIKMGRPDPPHTPRSATGLFEDIFIVVLKIHINTTGISCEIDKNVKILGPISIL